MTASLSEDWIARSNEATLHHLERQARSSPGVVPFVGAGGSMALGLKSWREILCDGAPPRVAPRVHALLRAHNYEGAAELLLRELGPDGFQNMVAASAGDVNIETCDFRSGTVALLPLLAKGPVVTTNFDRVLERAFEANGTPFESVISGPRPDLIVDALHGNRRVLIKLHGDWQDRVGRTFAESDYESNYGDRQPERKRELLAGAERLLFSARSMLFIGASLEADRTVAVLREVQREYAGIRHFAVVVAPARQSAFEQKERGLRACGVMPLWYQAKDPVQHLERVERIVAEVIERASVRTLERPVPKTRRPAAPVKAPARPSVESPEALESHFNRVVRLVEDGRLTFVLGSAIYYPTKLMAADFYGELARTFECEALREDQFAVAQYIVDRHGRENLNAEIRKLFARTPLVPRETHDLFASWGHFRTQAGAAVPFPLVMTTNYDDLLEQQLDRAGLPYHLLSYQADGPHRGLFYHRDPNDGLRIVERPPNIRSLSDGFVLVKLNGGFDRQRRIPESFAATRLDFWDLAARLPDVLPEVVKKRLSAGPLLFLGHGLAAADIESLVRFAHRGHPGPRSWAVVFKKEGIEYWRQCGVEILNSPVNLYSRELSFRLWQNGRKAAPPRADRRRARAVRRTGSARRRSGRGRADR